MKEILVVANLSHASPRIPGLANYLLEYGYRVTVLTPPIGGQSSREFLGFPAGFVQSARILETKYVGDVFSGWRKVFKKMGYQTGESITEQLKEDLGVSKCGRMIDNLMRAYQTVFAYPDTERRWKRIASRAARNAIRSTRFDCILSSSPFPTSHLVASDIKRRFQIPWIADFRDTWTQNPVYSFPKMRLLIERRLEQRTISGADRIITVSQPYASSLARLHRREVAVISNGYTEFNENELSATLSPRFVLTYTGVIYARKQDPSSFLMALRNLISQKRIDRNLVEVRFFGKMDAHLSEQTRSLGLSDIVAQYGTVSRLESRRKQMESQILLFFDWEDAKNKGLSHLKLYEYLASGRPILSTGGQGDSESHAILKETGCGVSARTVEEIERYLSRAYDVFQRTGSVPYSGIQKKIEPFSYRERAKELVKLLDQVTPASH